MAKKPDTQAAIKKADQELAAARQRVVTAKANKKITGADLARAIAAWAGPPPDAQEVFRQHLARLAAQTLTPEQPKEWPITTAMRSKRANINQDTRRKVRPLMQPR